MEAVVARVPTFCPFCQSPNPVLEVDEAKYRDFRQGKIYAKDVVGGDLEKAEWLITGACQPCWDRLFAESENES